MKIELGAKYLVVEQVSFAQYTFEMGRVLTFTRDSMGRLIGNRNKFQFVADEQRVKDFLIVGKLKLV